MLEPLPEWCLEPFSVTSHFALRRSLGLTEDAVVPMAAMPSAAKRAHHLSTGPTPRALATGPRRPDNVKPLDDQQPRDDGCMRGNHGLHPEPWTDNLHRDGG